MRILIDFNHPAHVHLFKNFIWEMKKLGHQVCLVARDKECTIQLLDAYKFKYIKRKGYKGLLGKTFGMLAIDWKLFRIAKKFRPDILIGGVGNVYIPVVASLLRKPAIMFDDTEHNKKAIGIIKRFATKIYTPEYFNKNLGRKQARYNGHHELAYLHPKYFTPKLSILKKLGVKQGDPYFILRFVSWEAIHDTGNHGIQNKKRIVTELEKYGKVFISSEGQLPDDLKKFQMNIGPEDMHDALYFASLFVGEGATMASEAAALGVPAIYTNTLPLGYINELEKYGLIYSATKDTDIIRLIKNIMKKQKKYYIQIKNILIKDKVDVTQFMVSEVLRQRK